jgi:very-short-patch-repair endonuclease
VASSLEDMLVYQLRVIGLPHPLREHRFAPPRKWRFDLCWPDRKLAVEVEGGQWVRGRHARPAGMRADCEKYNTALLDGWRVFRFVSDQVTDGTALAVLERVLK